MIQNKQWENDFYNENDVPVKNCSEKLDGENMDNKGYHHLMNEGIPTQTHGLVTTVPQNIATLKIGDKHAPTRNSLRHSRMIVLSKGRVPIEYLPAIVKYHHRAKTAMWIILIVGIVICFECSSLQIYAPNTKAQLNPFYAAVPILFSGIFGFVHLSCCRKEYPGLRRNKCEQLIKIFSITTSLFASVLAFIYIFNGVIHLLSFFYLECGPPDFLTQTCTCRLADTDMASSIFNNSWDYADLSCFEVYHVFNVIIGLTDFTCLAIIVLEIYYLNLHYVSWSEPRPTKNYNFI